MEMIGNYLYANLSRPVQPLTAAYSWGGSLGELLPRPSCISLVSFGHSHFVLYSQNRQLDESTALNDLWHVTACLYVHV